MLKLAFVRAKTERGRGLLALLSPTCANIHKHVRQSAISYSTATFLALARRKATTRRRVCPRARTRSWSTARIVCFFGGRVEFGRTPRVSGFMQARKVVIKTHANRQAVANKCSPMPERVVKPSSSRSRARNVFLRDLQGLFSERGPNGQFSYKKESCLSPSALGQRLLKFSLEKLMRFYFAPRK